jgi:hypothetical protein
MAVWGRLHDVVMPSHERLSVTGVWLRECEAHHNDACAPVRGSFVPKRLIDVGSSTNPHARLVECENLPARSLRYITLSHCWGSVQPLRTLRENEPLYRQAIPQSKIPQSFLDAMKAARALNIQYLWIDSLCIVQDDLAEWESEAARMKDIYSGAVLTIAAADAADSTEGFLQCKSLGRATSRSVTSHPPPVLFTAGSTGKAESKVVRVENGDTREDPWVSVLHSRGWTLQEIVLSRRVAIYTTSEVHWQCMLHHRTPYGVRFPVQASNHSHSPFRMPRLSLGLSPASQHNIWRTWASNFSGRSLTFATDKLPALAGITQYYQDFTGYAPVVGMWDRSLAGDLLWIRLRKAETDDDGESRWNVCEFPSWSWLRCRTVRFDWFNSRFFRTKTPDIVKDHVTCVAWSVVWQETPLTSMLRSAYIVLAGPIQEIHLSAAREGACYDPPYFDANGEQLSPSDGRPVPWRCAAQFDIPRDSKPCIYTCLLMRSRKTSDRSDVNNHHLKETFLILEPIQEGAVAPLVYRRIGLGCFFFDVSLFDAAVPSLIHLV